MFKHHLLIIYRNYKRFKGSYFINLAGLATGLTCILLIFLWINDELNVDRFHEKDERLFYVMVNRHNSEEIITQINSPGPLATMLLEEMPEVEYASSNTNAFLEDKSTLSNNDIVVKAIGDYVQKDYLNMFSYELLAGDKNQVLSDKNYIVISENLANKLFGTTKDVIGKTVELNRQQQFQVSGMFKNIPRNSSNRFDYLLSYELFKDGNHWLQSWENNAPGTYVVLKEGTNVEVFNDKIKNFVKNKNKNSNITIFLKPYSENYLYGIYENGKQVGGRIKYVQLFSIIAIFILLIACINFMNLSTARASRRVKEIGIKKAIGSDRKTLINQYLGESMLMTIISLIVSLILVYLFLPKFNEITEKDLTLSFDLNTLLVLFAITVVTGLVAGSYPALYLSGFKPAEVLKGELKTSWSEIFIRKGLVIFQFTLSIILIVSVLIVYKQIQYIQSKNLGYNKDNIVYFEREGWASDNLETFLSKLNEVPGVVSASSMSDNFIGGKTSTYDIQWGEKNINDMIDFQYRLVNYQMLETLKIGIAEGRSFSRSYKNDETKVVFNETAIKKMGINDPVGKKIKIFNTEVQIIGVAKDFQSGSLREEVKPLFFLLAPESTSKIMVKIKSGSEISALNQIKSFYKEYNDGFALDFKFLDADYQALYSSEKRIDMLSRYFAAIAILISCLGLFALAAFTSERRLKEIGVRKVLSASRHSIVLLLTKEFTRLVIIAILIAIPLSFLITKKWLDNFAYRIDLELWYFLISGFLALLIAWITVGVQAYKAAGKDPVECLRNNE